ncbi:hypothetical protein IV203_037580 [Nitzschia inconspicua]|uniref:SAP domain-containing protein n=1 Tax=Nitzschia inconspicua TaxID=303405 RepID=A0A9K3PYH9_9STRA|nr:hypothetical protein IV203_037580 [Nitzschia inconspicua]
MKNFSCSVSTRNFTLTVVSLLFLSLRRVVVRNEANAFQIVPQTVMRPKNYIGLREHNILPICTLRVSKLRNGESLSSTDENDGDDTSLSPEDRELLKQASKSQMVDLCRQFDLPSTGTKEEMLVRLRRYAAKKLEEEKIRLERRKIRVENGSDDDREKYEIVNDSVEHSDDQSEDDGVYFYYETKEIFPGFELEAEKEKKRKQEMPPVPLTREALTAPPLPPGLQPNERGERVVTVYSTTDHNDLTGVAAAQPGQAVLQDPMTGSIAEPEKAPWDLKQQNQKSEATSADIESAKDELVELISSLLAMTGAPGFQNDGDDDDDNNEMYSNMGFIRQKLPKDVSSFENPGGFVGFDPSKVSTNTLAKASKSIRMSRGQVLQDVVREFELRAVGYDGVAGDDKSRGGGHYRQVSMVRSFLEGFRRAEVGRLARETTSMLLDRLVSEGIEVLDLTLSSMSRAGDDTCSEAGELNDSLLDYLNDAIRQQEKKVEQMGDTSKMVEQLESAMNSEGEQEDKLDALWTVGEEDGTRVESFDPTDPKSQKVLQEELRRVEANEAGRQIVLPRSASEKLLLLLKLLRERVKIEAAFSNDEKSRNLRILAYCINLQSDKLRKELITKEIGYSLDRLDSFAELVSSSIEYGESTSHQLQPSKACSLNVPLLKRILKIANDVKNTQSWRASGPKVGGATP